VTTPSVIVATEQEQTVRLYVGAPSNGGMHQVAQLTTNKPIDPHDLADMAMSLSVQFAWLEESNGGLPGAPAMRASSALPAMVQGKESSHQPSIDPALGSYKTPRMAQQVACPVKGCGFSTRRKNMAAHLYSQKHKWTRTDANAAARMAKALDVPVTPPDPKHSAAARAAAKPNSVTKRQQNGKDVRVGKAGSIKLRTVIFPKVLAYVGQQGEVTSADLALRFGETTSVTGAWLRKLGEEKQVVCVNPDVSPGQQMRWRLPVTSPQPVTSPLAEPVTSSVGFSHEHEETPAPTPYTESEHQDD